MVLGRCLDPVHSLVHSRSHSIFRIEKGEDVVDYLVREIEEVELEEETECIKKYTNAVNVCRINTYKVASSFAGVAIDLDRCDGLAKCHLNDAYNITPG